MTEYEHQFVEWLAQTYDADVAERVEDYLAGKKLKQKCEDYRYLRFRTRLPDIYPERFRAEEYEVEEVDRLYSIARESGARIGGTLVLDERFYKSINPSILDGVEGAMFPRTEQAEMLGLRRRERRNNGDRMPLDNRAGYTVLDRLAEQDAYSIAFDDNSFTTFASEFRDGQWQEFHSAWHDLGEPVHISGDSYDLRRERMLQAAEDRNMAVITSNILNLERAKEMDAEIPVMSPDVAAAAFNALATD